VAGCVPAIYFVILSQFALASSIWWLDVFWPSILISRLDLHVLPQFGGWMVPAIYFDISSEFTRAPSIWWLDKFWPSN
jgi:hypothetical protein